VTDVARWQEALASEHAAIWGYGLVGATSPLAPVAQRGLSTHRDRRSRCIDAVVALGGEPVASAPAYQLDRPENADQARALAAELEKGCIVSYAALAGADDRSSRVQAARWMRESTISQWWWSGVVPPLPGFD
jgi:hypothetical protein